MNLPTTSVDLNYNKFMGKEMLVNFKLALMLICLGGFCIQYYGVEANKNSQKLSLKLRETKREEGKALLCQFVT